MIKNSMIKDSMVKDSISIVLSVHNQEEIIGDVIKGIFDNISNNVKDMFIILANCTDNSESKILFSLAENKKNNPFIVNLVYSEYSNKLITNNIGCKSSENEYSLIIPDNMIIDEVIFDENLLESFDLDGISEDAMEGRYMVLLKNSELPELNFEGIGLDE